MGKWTELAARLEREAEACDVSDISANRSVEGANVAIVTNVTATGSPVVAVWRDALASLDPDDAPACIRPDRWRRLLLDADAFLTDWGNQAAALGWSTIDLFGCSPGFARRLDRDGLVTGLEGRVVTMMTDTHAMIDAGDGKLWRHERRDRPGAVTWWSATHGVRI
jgi:hypothetical protein